MQPDKCPHGIEIHKNCFFCVAVLLREKGILRVDFVDKSRLDPKRMRKSIGRFQLFHDERRRSEPVALL
jgi:hypothetical protein